MYYFTTAMWSELRNCYEIFSRKKKLHTVTRFRRRYILICFLGFTLWTSAHGFHHFTLSNRKGWKCVWAFILLMLIISLVCCIIYYFYHVFSTAVYSRVTIEAPDKRNWPVTIICEKQAFTLNRINSVASLTISHASLLSW